MASLIFSTGTQPSLTKLQLITKAPPSPHPNICCQSAFIHKRVLPRFQLVVVSKRNTIIKISACASSSALRPEKRHYPAEESKVFVGEMRKASLKLHTKEHSKEGEKRVNQPEDRALSKWELSIEGLLSFLVETKSVHDALEEIVHNAYFPFYAELQDTGFERSKELAMDLKWLTEDGYSIHTPKPSSPGADYAHYLKELSENDPQAFICHFYNIYFAHTAGGRMIGKKISEKLLNNKVLHFYEWEGDLSQLSEIVKHKLNKITENWTREEKDHCLEETGKTFDYLGKILRLVMA